MPRKKRTRAHVLHPENVKAAWGYILSKNPHMRMFGRPGWWLVQEHENRDGIEWASTGCGSTKAEAIIDAAKMMGWKFTRRKPK